MIVSRLKANEEFEKWWKSQSDFRLTSTGYPFYKYEVVKLIAQAAFEHSPIEIPVCVNCNDVGCEFCQEDVEDPPELTDEEFDQLLTRKGEHD